jgi:ankyrin repeat protein
MEQSFASKKLKLPITKRAVRLLESARRSAKRMLMRSSKRGDLDRALRLAASYGDADILPLLKKGASPNARSAHGWTTLHWVASFSCAETCALLIENGANVNAEDNDGRTPLYCAAYNAHTETCMLLLEKGALDRGKLKAKDVAKNLGHKETELFLEAIEQLSAAFGQKTAPSFLKSFYNCIHLA